MDCKLTELALLFSLCLNATWLLVAWVEWDYKRRFGNKDKKS